MNTFRSARVAGTLLICFFLVVPSVFSQYFQNRYYAPTDPGSNPIVSRQLAYCVDNTSDGGQIMAGEVSWRAGKNTNKYIYLVKTDALGTVQWSRVMNNDVNYVARAIKQTAEGNYIIAGYNDVLNQAVLIKANSIGQTVWARQIASPYIASQGLALDFMNIPQVGWRYVMTGWVDVRDNNTNLTQRHVLFLYADDNGLCYMRTIGNSSMSSTGYSIASIYNGTVTTGFAITGEGNTHLLALKLDVYGNVLWAKQSQTTSIGYAVKHTRKGGKDSLVIAGFENEYWNADGALLRLSSSDGSVINSAVMGSRTHADIFYSLVINSAGEYVAVGYTKSFGAVGTDAYVVRTSDIGAVLNSKVYRGAVDETARSIVQTTTGNYAIAGYTNSFGAVDYNYYLIMDSPDMDQCGINVETERMHNMPLNGASYQSTPVAEVGPSSISSPAIATIKSTISLCCSDDGNLVRNPGFESHRSCPTGWSDSPTNDQVGINCRYWSKASSATPDYFNSCTGTSSCISGSNYLVGVPSNFYGVQEAHGGNAYVGVQARGNANDYSYREYVKGELCSPLEEGVTYNVKFYISLGDASDHVLKDAVTAYFTAQDYNQSTFGPLTVYPSNDLRPMIASNTGDWRCDMGGMFNDTWMEVTGTYTAVGGERYIILGYFDRTPEDTLTGGPGCNLGSGPTCYSSDRDQCYYYIDDVSVSLPSAPVTKSGVSGIEEQKVQPSVISVAPNPSNAVTTISYDVQSDGFVKLELFDGLGNVVATVREGYQTKGSYSFDYTTSTLAPGLYHLSMTANGVTYTIPVMIRH